MTIRTTYSFLFLLPLILIACDEGTTDPQPDDLPPLPGVTITTTPGATPGMVLVGYTGQTDSGNFAAVGYEVDGTVAWHYDIDLRIFDVQPQPNGNITVMATPRDREGDFHEVDRQGELVRHHRSTRPETGVHELRLLPAGRLLYGIERDTLDLTGLGGVAGAEVKQCIVEFDTPNGLRTWSTRDGMEMADSYDAPVGAQVNPYHVNAIELDTDGKLLISMRNASQIVKVDPETGAVVWRLGGKRNEFTFIDDPLGGFHRQHAIRRLPNGNIILFDNGNGHVPPVSRAVEYALDETAMTARMVWEYRDPALFSAALGFAQRLTTGNTLICYGLIGLIREVTPGGDVVWELKVDGVELPYRAIKVEE